MKIENISGSCHKKIFIIPTIEYEDDWGTIYWYLYFLTWKITLKRKIKGYVRRSKR